jgi:hypothetical protein
MVKTGTNASFMYDANGLRIQEDGERRIHGLHAAWQTGDRSQAGLERHASFSTTRTAARKWWI